MTHFNLQSLGAFSGALLFIAFVLVRVWQTAAPDVFLAWMAEHFFRFPTIMVPLNVIALLMAVAALATTWKPFSAVRLPWSLALLSLLLRTITFPVYFAEANTEFVTRSITTLEVASKVNTWSLWHWARTGLAIAATLFAAWGVYKLASITSSDQVKEIAISLH